MQNKQLEITDQWQSFEAYQALEKIDGVKVAALPSMTSFYYMVNTKKAPTDDVHFRLAMEYAFDYDAAVGLEWPGTKQMVGPVPASLAGHDANVTVYKRDLDKAKAELAQSKYAGQLDQNPVVVQWVSEVPDEEKYALLFQSNMADVGIKVNVVKVPWLSLVENTSKLASSPNIATIYVSSDLPEAGLMLKQRYSSSTAGTWQQNEWLQDPKLDAQIDDCPGDAETSRASIRQVWQDPGGARCHGSLHLDLRPDREARLSDHRGLAGGTRGDEPHPGVRVLRRRTSGSASTGGGRHRSPD